MNAVLDELNMLYTASSMQHWHSKQYVQPLFVADMQDGDANALPMQQATMHCF